MHTVLLSILITGLLFPNCFTTILHTDQCTLKRQTVLFKCAVLLGGPTVFMSSVRNKEITQEDYETCNKVADELAFSSVEFCPLDVSH